MTLNSGMEVKWFDTTTGYQTTQTRGFFMNTYNPETHVAVPKTELVKLEDSRIRIYEFLRDEGFLESIHNQYVMENITRQIWEVANKLKWEN